MTKENRHLKMLAKRGYDATITKITGDSCPCLASRDGEYNAIWHDDYPLAEDCEGSGIINRTKTTTNIKSHFTNDQESLSYYLNSEDKEVIGRRDRIDLIMFGAVKTSDYSKFDLSTLDEQSDYITYNSINYSLKDLFELESCQIAVLEKIDNAI